MQERGGQHLCWASIRRAAAQPLYDTAVGTVELESRIGRRCARQRTQECLVLGEWMMMLSVLAGSSLSLHHLLPDLR